MLGVVRGKISSRVWTSVSARSAVPRGAEPYDLIVCSSVCAFVDDYPSLVAELVGTMTPSGLFVRWDRERDPADDEPFGLARDEIRAVLSAAGLTSVDIDTAFSLSVGGHDMRPLVGSGRVPLS